MATAVRRVRDTATFGALRRQGRRARGGPLTVTWLPADASVQLAFAISRRVGNAVVRNRLRRRLRAIVAEAQPPLPPGTYLVSASPDAADLDSGALRRNLQLALDQLALDEPHAR